MSIGTFLNYDTGTQGSILMVVLILTDHQSVSVASLAGQ